MAKSKIVVNPFSHLGGKRTYGWKPDLPDHRDFKFAAPHRVMKALPPSVDMRSLCPPIVDQGQLGSCTANAIAGAVEFDMMKEGVAAFPASRLFIYYNEPALEGSIHQDAGAMIRDGFKTLAQWGVCPETLWPYTVSQFAKTPSSTAYAAATKHRSANYASVAQSLAQMQGVVASGFPIVVGFTVYESFESATVAATGIVPLPSSNEQVLGGHAVLVVGYDNASQRFIVRNSWGTSWGQAGYFTMPYAYLTNPDLSSDFWVLNAIK